MRKTRAKTAKTDDNKTAILDGLADGKSLREICRQPGMPAVSTVLRWCGEDLQWQEQYARARESGSDAMAEDIQAIADGIAHASDPVSVNAARLQIDARKWLLAKRQPKKYGEKVDLNLGGQQQDAGPVQFEFKIVK